VTNRRACDVEVATQRARTVDAPWPARCALPRCISATAADWTSPEIVAAAAAAGRLGLGGGGDQAGGGDTLRLKRI